MYFEGDFVSAKIWFILSAGQVTGPYSPEEVEGRLNTSQDPQIWGRGQSEWMTPSKWRQSSQELLRQAAILKAEDEVWHLRVAGKDRGTHKYPDLVRVLRAETQFDQIEVLPPHSSWKDIYTVPQLAEELGLSRRNTPRVPIIGTLKCRSPRLGEFACRLISVSEGGLGVNDAKNMQIGDQFEAIVESPNLYVTMNITCEVVYVGQDGYAGMRFVGLPMEFKNVLIEYVNKFATP